MSAAITEHRAVAKEGTSAADLHIMRNRHRVQIARGYMPNEALSRGQPKLKVYVLRSLLKMLGHFGISAL